jgi:hypothetical protein
MKNINPLHIGLLLIIILLFLMLQLSNSKEALTEAGSEYATTKQLVNKLSSLKRIYGNKEKVKRSLKRVLGLASLKSAGISEKSIKNGVELSSASMDKRALDSLMGKLLNGSYNINKLKIKKLSDEKASFYMEIKW